MKHPTRAEAITANDEVVELALTTTVPRSMLTVAMPPPATVTQQNVFEHFGIKPNQYLRMARAGAFPTKRVGRLRVVSYEVLLEHLTAGAKAELRYRKAVEEPKGNEKPAPNPRAREEAVDWLWSSRTYADLQARKAEIVGKGWDLSEKYGPKLWDGESDETGRPNPEYDKALYEQGLDLVTAVAMVTWRKLRQQLIESGELVVKPGKKRT